MTTELQDVGIAERFRPAASLQRITLRAAGPLQNDSPRMHVHYWAVGQRTPVPLPLTLDLISGYLVEDWVPSIVPPPGSTFIGWPASLIRSEHVDGTAYWSLDAVLGRTERQWKRVISWMLGVAGARHLLARERYRWIAPASAFYPGGQEVDTTHWHPQLPPGVVEVTGPNRYTNLRPDYLAIRPRRVTGVRTLAAVEAKGTDDTLGSALKHRCPPAWRRQVWNIAVTVHGQSVRVPRHIVAATRVNPNAKLARTRCLQVRGWNAEDRDPVEAPPQLATEVAAGHLFGLCLNLGLWRNAEPEATGGLPRPPAGHRGKGGSRWSACAERRTPTRAQAWRGRGTREPQSDASPPQSVAARIEQPPAQPADDFFNGLLRRWWELTVDSSGMPRVERIESGGTVWRGRDSLTVTGHNHRPDRGLVLVDSLRGRTLPLRAGSVVAWLSGTGTLAVDSVRTLVDSQNVAIASRLLVAGPGSPPALREFVNSLRPRLDHLRTRSWLTPPRVEAIGGFPLLIRDGVPTPDSVLNAVNLNESDARTAVALRDAGRRQLLVTVRARNPGGIPYRELARLLLQLGAEDALNLDGGPSTWMTVADPVASGGFRPAWGRIADSPQVSVAIAAVRACGFP